MQEKESVTQDSNSGLWKTLAPDGQARSFLLRQSCCGFTQCLLSHDQCAFGQGFQDRAGDVLVTETIDLDRPVSCPVIAPYLELEFLHMMT